MGSIHDSDDVADLHDALTTAMDAADGYQYVFGAIRRDADVVDFELELANTAACEAVGLTVDDLQGLIFDEMNLFPASQFLLKSRLTEAVLSGHHQEFSFGDSATAPDREFRVRCIPDGDRVFMSVTPIAPSQNHRRDLIDPADFDRAFDASDLAFAFVRLPTGSIQRITAAMAALLGAERDDLRNCFLQDFVGDADTRRFQGALTRLRNNPDLSQHLQIDLTGFDGKTRTAQLSLTPFSSGRVLVQASDRSANQLAAEQSAQLARDFQMLVESMSDMVLRLDPAGLIDWATPSFARLVGPSSVSATGRSFLEFVHKESRRAAAAAVSAAASGREARDFILRMNTPADGGVAVRGNARPMFKPTGGAAAVVLTLRNIDGEMTTAQQLADLALRDPLSGLGTRAAMVEQLAGELESPGARLAVLEVHIDRLGRLNDAITYSGADQVIVAVAERLRTQVGVRGETFRTGAGDFGVVLRETETISQALVMAERLRSTCTQPLTVGEHRITPSLSVGVAVARGADVNKLLYDANRAMRAAKLRGRNQCAIADDRGGLEATRWLVDEAELNDALREGRYNAYYQPIVTLPDGVVAGFEVLVRCRQPDGSATLSAGQMAVAESTGSIKQIDRLVLRQALVFLHRLDERKFISVNVSVRSLADPTYLEWMENAVRTAGIDPARVRLEVTEATALAVPPSTRTAMERLVKQGFTWYMDDFGTGYSSLTSLRDLPMRGLKLDRSFTALLTRNPNRVQNLTEGIVQLANAMELVTVAEGVETHEEATLLAQQGWQFGQGFLFGRAMPPENAVPLAAAGRTVTLAPSPDAHDTAVQKPKRSEQLQ